MAKKSAFARAVSHARVKLDRRPVAHFLHVGKTAGTALKYALSDVERSSAYRLMLHTHWTRLNVVPEDDFFFFCVRDPISRFVSGFLSRQREGKPRYVIRWREDEKLAFSRFDSPDGLAVALSAGGREQQSAEDAMHAIRHVRDSYWFWFKDPDYFRQRSDHILWVGRQESLDIESLASTLGVDALHLPDDPIVAHLYTEEKPVLSDLARENLRNWYAKDYEFLELCAELVGPRRTR
jgi:hypothetical protein